MIYDIYIYNTYIIYIFLNFFVVHASRASTKEVEKAKSTALKY